jgi:hypothetical protein
MRQIRTGAISSETSFFFARLFDAARMDLKEDVFEVPECCVRLEQTNGIFGIRATARLPGPVV